MAESTTTVLSASRIMASGTVVSRVTGLFRALLLVAAIGNVGAHPDIFNVANTIPNSLYILVAGGVFNAVLVPQLVRAMKVDRDGGDAYANRIISLGALVLAAVTVVLVVFAPLLLRILAPSYFTDPTLAGERDSLVAFARYCLPQIFFYGMFVLIGQILNARGRFGPMMWAPIANNLISIAILAAYLVRYDAPSATGGYTTTQEFMLGFGSTLGIAVQTFLLLPYLRRTGFRIRPRRDFRGTGLGHTLRLAKWTVAFVVVNQIAFYVMVHLSTSATAQAADAAGFTVYSNAFLLTQLPHSIVTVSLATATIPLVSRLAAEGRMHDMAGEMGSSLRLVLAVIVPFALAMLVLGPALATLLFGYGAGAGDTRSLGITIIAFAPGMLMFSIHYMVLRGFYALEDTRGAFLIQCVIAAVNVVSAIVLTSLISPVYAAPALALAYGAAYTSGAVLSSRILTRRLHERSLGLLRFVVRVTVAALPATALTWGLLWLMGGVGLETTRPVDAAIMLAVSGTVGLATYLAMARLLNISEIRRIVATVVPSRASSGRSHEVGGERPTMVHEQGVTAEGHAPREAGRRHVATHPVETGVVLAERYALEDRLSEEGESTTWRAHDRVLARSVVLQIIPSSSPAATEMVAAAKQASRVADPRVLQVLDAVDDGQLSYVVREWANGQSLEVVLAEGPMPARKATFLLREVAGAISTAHRMGLRHGRLAPDTIVLTKSSGVKVLGLGTLAALRTDPDEIGDPELADTRDLGRLLYACLTARWPGGSAGTLPAAPTEHGKLLRPRQVRAGVPRSLDILCDRILGAPPRGGSPITSVDEVKNALSAIIANDGVSERAGMRAQPDLPGAEAAPLEPPPAILADDGGPVTGDTMRPVGGSGGRPPRREQSRVGRTLRWTVLLILGVGLMLLLYLIAWRLPSQHASTPKYVNHTRTTPSTTGPATNTNPPPPAQLQPIQISSATSFDPPPQGSGDENPAEASLAIDGNPATAWSTLTYFGGPTFGGIKPGVGLVLDLGGAEQVSEVKLTLVGKPTSVQIRAAPASATSPPTDLAGYDLVASRANVGTQVTIPFERPVTTRYLLVWLTSVPAVSGGYAGKIAEIQVLG